jgi:uncharacterized protein (TIGR03437 family)
LPRFVLVLALVQALVLVWGQARGQETGVGWRHVGNAAIDTGQLPSAATGPVDRVWYSPDGSSLFAKTASGRVFETPDFEQWQLVTDGKATPPATNEAGAEAAIPGTPEVEFKLATPSLGASAAAGRLYGIGNDVYRSDDGGVRWINLTSYKGACLLGAGLRAVTVSPMDPDEVVVASDSGVWRSLDGGVSWIGLNQFLPNLPAVHLVGLPSGTRGVRLELAGGSEGVAREVEWAPGEKSAWKPADAADLDRDQNLKSALSQVLKRPITVIAAAEDYIYAGDSEGRLQVSADAGASWGVAFRLGEQGKSGELGKVESIWVDSADPRVAVAVLGARSSLAAGSAKPAYVLRTMNGGSFWDDITANLPDTAAAHGVAADRGSGAIYVATDAGLFYTTTDLGSAGRPTVWTSLREQLPAGAAVTDVQLDAGGNQLFAVLEGFGVYTTIAPHRLRDARIVNAADYSARPTAPGALLSVLGARVESARSQDATAPVLDANEMASQIQVPFEAKGDSVSLSLQAASGPLTFGVQLKSASPAIFVDPEGTPLIMDAQSGVLLDAGKPARANSRIQVLATGLGQVNPDWPTGLAAPLNDPPRVTAAVHAYLDGSPVEVTEASLARGLIGFYLIEIQVPRIADTGPAELYIEAAGQQSNRVRLYVEQ